MKCEDTGDERNDVNMALDASDAAFKDRLGKTFEPENVFDFYFLKLARD